jgi:hypothetical protein
MMTGPGSSDIVPLALEVSQAVASPLTTQVGPELRDVSEPETFGRVCATAGSAAVRSVPAVSMPTIKVRMAFSPSHFGGEGIPTALRIHETNALVVPRRLDLGVEPRRFVELAGSFHGKSDRDTVSRDWQENRLLRLCDQCSVSGKLTRRRPNITGRIPVRYAS